MNDLAREKLFEVISSCGRTIYNTPRTAEMMLNANCGAFPDEKRVLVQALQRGVVADMVGAPRTHTWEEVSNPLAVKLAKQAGVGEDEARWAVESWAMALGLHPDSAPAPEQNVVAVRGPLEEGKAKAPHWAAPYVQPIMVGIGGGVGAMACGIIVALAQLLRALAPDQWIVLFALLYAVVGFVGGSIGGALGWAMVQNTGAGTRTADEDKARMFKAMLATCGGAFTTAIIATWCFGIFGLFIVGLCGALGAAVSAGYRS
jgi:hypothetical protein